MGISKEFIMCFVHFMKCHPYWAWSNATIYKMSEILWLLDKARRNAIPLNSLS